MASCPYWLGECQIRTYNVAFRIVVCRWDNQIVLHYSIFRFLLQHNQINFGIRNNDETSSDNTIEFS